MKKKSTIREKIIPFEKVQKAYGLSTPEQIKLRIIWNHVQVNTLCLLGEINREKLKRSDAHFRSCEKSETVP